MYNAAHEFGWLADIFGRQHPYIVSLDRDSLASSSSTSHAGSHTMELITGCKLIIRSVTEDGRKFRPSDWIERISTTMATFGKDNRLHYSNDVRPGMVDGEKCLLVENSVKESNPSAFEYIMAFVKANRLQMSQVCETKISELSDSQKSEAS